MAFVPFILLAGILIELFEKSPQEKIREYLEKLENKYNKERK